MSLGRRIRALHTIVLGAFLLNPRSSPMWPLGRDGLHPMAGDIETWKCLTRSWTWYPGLLIAGLLLLP